MSCPYHPSDTAGYPARRAVADRDTLLAMKEEAKTFVLGTRKSNLALTQTGHVADALRELHNGESSSSYTGELMLPQRLEYTFSIEHMTTVGDRNQTTPLHLLSPYNSAQPAKSLWTDELEAKLLGGHFDLLVHSLKDVPTTLKDGCEIGCMVKREDPRDALVVKKGLDYKRLEDLPDGAVVGTGSVRRVAQLKRAFPNLRFEDMRGNLNTRFSKLDTPSSPFAALILAISGLTRLGMEHRVTSPLSSPTLWHAVGQGALGIEIRSNDPRVRNALRGLGHWETEWRCGAERGCLRVLEGGCSVPVGVESQLEELDAYIGDDVEGIDDPFALEDESVLVEDSPMLWFSGLVDLESVPGTPFTPMFTHTAIPPLRRRLAKLTLEACVTSTDGTKHVLYKPKAVLVRSYRQAEKWGEECARRLSKMGGKEILDEINQLRKMREKEDWENAILKSKEEYEKKLRVDREVPAHAQISGDARLALA